ncbi:MAG: cysteine desulfurase [Gemmatimonadetes bacterium]|nr:cysteine desulfurase [Gemmatimonadota bacterium]
MNVAQVSSTHERLDRAASVFDVQRVRRDFPILGTSVNGKPLVYLDNAATAQKPQAVIDAVSRYYANDNANIHRGVHYLSERATAAYEDVRRRAQVFLGAGEAREVVFVRGTTDAINLVAHSYVRPRLEAGDEVVISAMEHHSNIVPWQLACGERGARLRVVPMTQAGELMLDAYEELLNDRTKMVALGHISNALGTVNPIKEMVRTAKERGIPVLVDGAQAAPHLTIDVSDLGCDFYAVSGHKMFGPTGTGLLYGRAELLEAMSPYQGGGDMIETVSFERSTYARIPAKFEAGTPNIAGVVGLGAAIDYLLSIGRASIAKYESELLQYAVEAIGGVEGIRLVGTPRERAGVVSFLMEGIHPHDVGTIVDQEGVAIRTGHHCAQPVMDFYGIAATARASFAFYNTREEVDSLVTALGKTHELFG